MQLTKPTTIKKKIMITSKVMNKNTGRQLIGNIFTVVSCMQNIRCGSQQLWRRFEDRNTRCNCMKASCAGKEKHQD